MTEATGAFRPLTGRELVTKYEGYDCPKGSLADGERIDLLFGDSTVVPCTVRCTVREEEWERGKPTYFPTYHGDIALCGSTITVVLKEGMLARRANRS